MKPYYQPREIIFVRDQVEFLLPYLVLLKEGRYPPEPSSYTDTGKRNRNFKAPFTTPCEIAAELKARMEVCGQDGYLALEHYYDGVPIESENGVKGISDKRMIDIRLVERRIRKVVSYISSGTYRRWMDNHKRRGINYKDWCKLYNRNRWDRNGGVRN